MRSQPVVDRFRSVRMTNTNIGKISNALTHWLLRFDGGSRGNPGRGGCGAVLYKRVDAGWKEYWCGYDFLGNEGVTSNFAEYQGLILGLKAFLLQNGAQRMEDISCSTLTLSIEGDSQLVIRQLLGTYSVRNTVLQRLHAEARALMEQTACTSITHIPRERNSKADELSNLAMDVGQEHPANLSLTRTVDATFWDKRLS
jgi:ribonuclease HI